jgi:hypothetical protein
VTYILDDRHLDELAPPCPVGDPHPPAAAILQRGRGCWCWVVARCPICGRRHQHGGGPLGGDPRRLLSHRLRHCGDLEPGTSRGYELVDADPARTAACIATHHGALRWDR